jgi:hypothetical protein
MMLFPIKMKISLKQAVDFYLKNGFEKNFSRQRQKDTNSMRLDIFKYKTRA